LLDDGGKLHGALKMIGTEPEPESFDVPPSPRDLSQADEEAVVAESPSEEESVEAG
jgi:hypothetical protein